MHHIGQIHIEVDTHNPWRAMRGQVWFWVVNEGTGHKQQYLERACLRQTTELSEGARQMAVLDVLINQKLPRLYRWLGKQVGDGTLQHVEGGVLKLEALGAWHIE